MDYTLHNGDCIEFMRTLPAESVDAVVTDPPYPKEFLHLWQPFAEESYRVLRPGGELITLLGHYQLPHVMSAFASTPFRFWWICGMLQNARSKMFGKRVAVYWKPALWYIKGTKRALPDMPMDMLAGKKTDKANHKWEQPVGWFAHWCERICKDGETILDPFAGSGTTGIACAQTGRRFIGCEIDAGYYEIAKRRIDEAYEHAKREPEPFAP